LTKKKSVHKEDFKVALNIAHIYQLLYDTYQAQGWWPLSDLYCPTAAKEKNIRGYHPGNFQYPLTRQQQYEICLGAILTQNTSWKQVEKALANLLRADALTPEHLQKLPENQLKELLKPAGYYNQKTIKIKLFTEFFLHKNTAIPSRTELLRCWGIGHETADSMLLYAYQQPVFVIDAYTNRLFSRLLNTFENNYHTWQSYFENFYHSYSPEHKIQLYNEYHALIVEHGKSICKPKPLCPQCPLISLCQWPHS
jgi:endonuclease-3 related protein